MASHQQKRDLSKTARQPRAGTMTAASSTASTSIVGSSQVDSVLPYTTFVTATLTDSIPLQQPTSTPALSHSLQLSSNSSLHASASSSHKSSASIHHVPSEADVPEKWGPKDLDVEKHRQYKFMGGIALICVITVVGIIGIGWWRGLWKSKVIRRAFVERTVGSGRDMERMMARNGNGERAEEAVARAKFY